jgi:adenylyltransferase/sulfurtransferase
MKMFTQDEMTRYSRHLLLPEVGKAGQERLKSARVLVVGAGGLGSPVLLYLASAGVGTIGIIDHDTVDLSNLQRQVIHDSTTVNLPKVTSARQRILAINPNCNVRTFETSLCSENAIELLSAFDLVIDGTDNFPTRYLLADASEMVGIPFIYGAIFRFDGQVSVFNHKGGPGYRDLFPTPPTPGSVPTCAATGVLGVLPGVVGTIQATEAIKVILDIGETLSGRLLLYSALSMRVDQVTFERDKDRQPADKLIDYVAFCSGSTDKTTASSRGISPSDLQDLLAGESPPLLLDIRDPQELEICTISHSAKHVPLAMLGHVAAELPRDRAIVLYCHNGQRSHAALMALITMGFNPTLLQSLTGGILAWAEQVDKTLATY